MMFIENFLAGLSTESFFYASLIFVAIRTLPIIIPPIPGLVVDLAGIAIFGWLYGYILAGFGVMIGSSVSFYMARTFREPLVSRFASLRKIHEWEKLYSDRKKFWGLVILRLTTSPLFDYVGYAAALTKMRFSTFFWTTFLGAAPLGFVTYYFGGLSFAQGPYGIAAFVVLLALGWFILRRATPTPNV